jgi:hypothetical protein
MTGSTQNATWWLAAARGGSREALGQLLEACRGYLLLIAQRELDPDLCSSPIAQLIAQRDLRFCATLSFTPLSLGQRSISGGARVVPSAAGWRASRKAQLATAHRGSRTRH